MGCATTALEPVTVSFDREWHIDGTSGHWSWRSRRILRLSSGRTRTGRSERSELARGPKRLMEGPDLRVSAGPASFSCLRPKD